MRTTPESQSSYITYGSFNTQPKNNSSLIELWAKVLKKTPNSKLLLKNHACGELSMQKDIISQFEPYAIEQDRLIILGNIAEMSGHLAAHGRVDIALDPFPYHGTTTTCEALWMGLPVVTLEGECHVSRVGVSLLSQIGYPEWIAKCQDEYVEIAVRLAKDSQGRSALRYSLREIMENSPLMDAKRFACDIESAYQEIWRIWCEKATESL